MIYVYVCTVCIFLSSDGKVLVLHVCLCGPLKGDKSQLGLLEHFGCVSALCFVWVVGFFGGVVFCLFACLFWFCWVF